MVPGKKQRSNETHKWRDTDVILLSAQVENKKYTLQKERENKILDKVKDLRVRRDIEIGSDNFLVEMPMRQGKQ